jgi:hypothetical protein
MFNKIMELAATRTSKNDEIKNSFFSFLNKAEP